MDSNRKATRRDIQRVRRFLDDRERSYESAIQSVFGHLPDYVPAHHRLRIRQAIDSMRDAEQSDSRIAEVVLQARRHTLIVPGTARDSVRFTNAAYDLAHVQWALTLGKSRAIAELSGDDAALGVSVRDQRQSFSQKGNTTKKVVASTKERKWREIGKPLRAAAPEKSDRWLARQIARISKDKESTIRAALSRVGLSKSQNG